MEDRPAVLSELPDRLRTSFTPSLEREQDESEIMELEIFSDYIWPYCYFITGRIERLQKEYDVTVRWRTFPLHPETPEDGQLLEDLFRTSPEKIAGMVARLRVAAEELGLPFGPRNKTYNSRLAQELGLWAEEQGKGEPFHLAAFHAYFADGLNLAKMPVLLDLARKVGLPEKEAKQVITSRAYKTNVDRDWEDSRLKAITAVPTFVMGQHKLVGAQNYETLQELVSYYGVPVRK